PESARLVSGSRHASGCCQLCAAPCARLTGPVMQRLKSLSTLFCGLVLLASLGCAATRTHEGTGEYVDDSVITTKVKAAIFNEPTLKSTEINVETYKGTVQLSGFVSQPADIAKAAEVARSVKGVTAVKNDIRVK